MHKWSRLKQKFLKVKLGILHTSHIQIIDFLFLLLMLALRKKNFGLFKKFSRKFFKLLGWNVYNFLVKLLFNFRTHFPKIGNLWEPDISGQAYRDISMYEQLTCWFRDLWPLGLGLWYWRKEFSCFRTNVSRQEVIFPTAFRYVRPDMSLCQNAY